MEADDIRYIKRAFKGMHMPFSLDLMNEIKSVENDFYGIGKDEYKEIWIKVPKPSYDEFRHIFLEEDNEATEQEIKENYEFEYSEEYYFHNLAFVENRDGGQFLFIDKELNMCYEKDKTSLFYYDVEVETKVVKNIKRRIQQHVLLIKNGKYEAEILSQIPYNKKVGSINRAVLWKVVNNQKTYGEFDDFKNRKEYLEITEENFENTLQRVPAMTSGMFFECCKAGYDENDYDTENLNPREAYLKYADRRDEGLSNLPINDADAFSKWYEERQGGGHPWEVCRGGNSTHVDLFVKRDEKGFVFVVAGSSENRFLESINFYIAIKRLGYPVEIRQGALLAQRLQGNETIGIVPHNVIPRYCWGLFPDEKVFSFRHLYEEEKQAVPFVKWKTIEVPELNKF